MNSLRIPPPLVLWATLARVHDQTTQQHHEEPRLRAPAFQVREAPLRRQWRVRGLMTRSGRLKDMGVARQGRADVGIASHDTGASDSEELGATVFAMASESSAERLRSCRH